MLGAVMFGHRESADGDTRNQRNSRPKPPSPSWNWQPPARDESMIAVIKGAVGSKLEEAFQVRDKLQRRGCHLRNQGRRAGFAGRRSEQKSWQAADMAKEFAELEYRTLRDSVLKTEVRIDGRQLDDVRRDQRARRRSAAHARFCAVHPRRNPGAGRRYARHHARRQIIDAPEGESKDPFLFHYNFPPFSVGEAGRFGAPKRREIGHGRLAKRGADGGDAERGSVPYALRVVSEITESNGSSSMASVCGGSLALMDAGVPIKAPVAGIAMGLIKEGDQFVVLTDILGDEDHLGDMDFKVAGTARRHHARCRWTSRSTASPKRS